MQIIITGGAGFIGQRLALALSQSRIPFDELVIADVVRPSTPTSDPRVKSVTVDLSQPGAARNLLTSRTALLFHLAAVVSSHAEQEFDLGWSVNLDTTRALLEACRAQGTGIRFVFASSLAVYGGHLPVLVGDSTAVTPQSSYGAQKAVCELLVNDYARKGFVDGRVLRLPTVCVRPGRPNMAASSFVSSIIREPLNDEDAICPVSPQLGVWLSSPDTVVNNILHGAEVEASAFGFCRTVNLPGIGVTIEQMLQSLVRVAGEGAGQRVRFEHDPAIERIVSSWPSAIDNTRALDMGFAVDKTFDDFINQFKAAAKPTGA